MSNSDSSTAPPPQVSQLKSFLSGGFGGMCLVLAGHPLDLIKVRLQTSSEFSGMWDCAKTTVQRDGVRGLYRGMGAPLLGITPIFAVCFWGYDIGKRLSRWGSPDQQSPLSLAQISFAGGFSAIPTTIIMTPVERVKCLIQVQGTAAGAAGPQFKGPMDAASHLLRTGGVSSLYRGTMATLLRDVPGSVAYFAAYEVVKKSLSRNENELSPLAVLFAGGMAGIANWTVAIPLDVLKSRLQTAPEGMYRGVGDVLVKLIKSEGPAALFKGLGPAMVRAFPANAACFLGVELSLKAMNSLW